MMDLGLLEAKMRAKADLARMRRAGGEESLLDFIPTVSRRFERPAHLHRLAELFARARREPVYACVSVPPRHGKTELLLHGIAWLLKQTPDREMGYVSYEASIARSKSRLARDYATTAGVDLREDANSLHEWLTPQGGGLRTGGIGGPLTGHGFRTLVIDDPFKNREEAESHTIREKNWDWLTSTALTRLEPDGSVLIVHTRWHEDDMIGRCLRENEKHIDSGGEDGHRWEHINLQAVSDETGQALWPRRWPLAVLHGRRRAIGEYDWASLFQGQPRRKGSQLFGDPVRYDQPALDGRRIYISVDIAGTKSTQAHRTIAVVAAYKGALDTVEEDILEVHRWQETTPEVARRLERLQQRWGVSIVVEASGLGKAVVQMLRELNPRLVIVEVYPTADKFVRAQPYSAAWNQGRVRVPTRIPDVALASRLPGETYWGGQHEIGEFVRVHKGFTGVNDAEDDDVDAAAHGFNHAAEATAKPPRGQFRIPGLV